MRKWIVKYEINAGEYIGILILNKKPKKIDGSSFKVNNTIIQLSEDILSIEKENSKC